MEHFFYKHSAPTGLCIGASAFIFLWVSLIEATFGKIQQLVRKHRLTVSYATFATCPKLSIYTKLMKIQVSVRLLGFTMFTSMNASLEIRIFFGKLRIFGSFTALPNLRKHYHKVSRKSEKMSRKSGNFFLTNKDRCSILSKNQYPLHRFLTKRQLYTTKSQVTSSSGPIYIYA